MHWQFTPTHCLWWQPIAVSTPGALWLVPAAWPGATFFVLLMLAVSEWFADLCPELDSSDLSAKILFDALEFLALSAYRRPGALALCYTGREKWLSPAIWPCWLWSQSLPCCWSGPTVPRTDLGRCWTRPPAHIRQSEPDPARGLLGPYGLLLRAALNRRASAYQAYARAALYRRQLISLLGGVLCHGWRMRCRFLDCPLPDLT